MNEDQEDLELEFADDTETNEDLEMHSESSAEVADEATVEDGGTLEARAEESNEVESSDDGSLDEESSDGEAVEAAADVESGELEGTELENFEAADIEDVEMLEPEQIRAIVEASLFATDKPISIALIKQVFKGTQVKSKEVRAALSELQEEYNGSHRGFTLEEIAGGFQLRTKPEVMKYLRQSVKARPFKLSGPALEVLSIVAYKQPTTKSQIDEIRGVESGHLLRALMEKSLLTFGERSDLPGKPMFYETTKKFLEIFSLRNLGELPSLSEIDQLIPEGIGEVEDKETLSDLTGELSKEAGKTYSEGEEELLKITDELTQISTSSDFFEQEKQRERERRDKERARDIREAVTLGDEVQAKDLRWLERYDQAQAEASASQDEVAFVTAEDGPVEASGAESDEEVAAEGMAEPIEDSSEAPTFEASSGDDESAEDSEEDPPEADEDAPVEEPPSEREPDVEM